MTEAAFALESFALPAGRLPAILFDRPALDQAYQDGLADGLRQGRDAGIDALCAALHDLGRALGEDERRRAEIAQDSVASLMPLLDELLDHLGSMRGSHRLSQALHQQLTRLSRAIPPRQLRLSCPDRLRAMVEEVLAEMPEIAIETAPGEGDAIEIAFEGGRVDLSPPRITALIRDMLDETLSTEGTWTSCTN